MTAMEAAMNDETPAIGGQIARIGLMVLAGTGALFGIGLIAGVIAANAERGGEIGLKLVGLVGGGALFAAFCGWVGWRTWRAMSRAAGAPTSRERRNRMVLIACGALGGAMGMLLTLAGPSPFAAFTNEPIPTALAIALAVPIALVLPVVSYYWHRHVADEQEVAAYNRGAMVGISLYFMGAPTWWLLWRGGLLPAPDGIAIYFITVATTGIVWLWAKYR